MWLNFQCHIIFRLSIHPHPHPHIHGIASNKPWHVKRLAHNYWVSNLQSIVFSSLGCLFSIKTIDTKSIEHKGEKKNCTRETYLNEEKKIIYQNECNFLLLLPVIIWLVWVTRLFPFYLAALSFISCAPFYAFFHIVHSWPMFSSFKAKINIRYCLHIHSKLAVCVSLANRWTKKH